MTTPAGKNTRVVCLNTRGRTPSAADLAAVDRFAALLTARGWADAHPELVELVAQARADMLGHGGWDGLATEVQGDLRAKAKAWLTAIHLAGLVDSTEPETGSEATT